MAASIAKGDLHYGIDKSPGFTDQAAVMADTIDENKREIVSNWKRKTGRSRAFGPPPGGWPEFGRK